MRIGDPFEDYRYNDSAVNIARLRRAVEYGYLRPREYDFVKGTVLRKCVLDYELQTKLSGRQQPWIVDILRRIP